MVFHSSLLARLRAVLSLPALFLLPTIGQAQGQIPGTPTKPPTTNVATLPGFKVERIYSVPKASQGSWVALTVDDKGRLIAGDQYGGIFRITLPPSGSADAPKVEPLKTELTGAHGLLYAFHSLYVMVNEGSKKGLWRLKDKDGDEQFEPAEWLVPIVGKSPEGRVNGGGEHGLHSVVLSPDGKSLYFTSGNHTPLPKSLEKSRPVHWGEDHLVPRIWDPRGHARGIFAPGGNIIRTDPDGKNVEMFAMGFRNAFDFAFDANGEMFTYDSDMEWDIGSPWYMPTRINHVVDGGDYGWRSGSGRWPAYYADSLPAVVNVGPGSPTGMVFGTGAKFPAKYQTALFAADWTYSTLYAIHFIPDGATFRAEKEEFVSGKPLPLTDVVINPKDGAMYFAAGGRRTESALYRVTYIGKESTSLASLPPPTPAALQRQKLDALHQDNADPKAIELAWPNLSSSDRFLRFSARVALEHQPATLWSERALAETNPTAAIESLIGLARVGEKSLQPKIIAALGRLDFTKMSRENQLPLLRAWELTFTRMGHPAEETTREIIKVFDPLFPNQDTSINRELVALLTYLGSPSIVAKTVPLLKVAEPAEKREQVSSALTSRNDAYGDVVQGSAASRPDRQQIALAYALRTAKVGWTPALRNDYFAWFKTTHKWKGGLSFNGFIENIRTIALATIVEDGKEKATLAELSQRPPPSYLTTMVPPKGPGRDYTVDDAMKVVTGNLVGRNYAHGKSLFAGASCIMCHVYSGEGGSAGPELTRAALRYSARDLLESIIQPSLVVSDIYAAEELSLKDGSKISGHIAFEEHGSLFVVANPYVPQDLTLIKESDIVGRKENPVSQMPPGLLNGLNEDEVKDLVAYILSSANPKDPMFAAKP